MINKKILTLLVFVFLISSCSIRDIIKQQVNDGYSGPYHYSDVQTQYPELYRDAADAIDQENYQEAESIYREIISLEPDLADGYIGLATSLSLQQREADAIEVYQDALNIRPESVDAYIGLGSAFYSLEMYDDSLQSYSTALSLDQNNPHGHWGMALALVKTNRSEEAVEHLSIVIELVPNSSLAEYAEKLLRETEEEINR